MRTALLVALLVALLPALPVRGDPEVPSSLAARWDLVRVPGEPAFYLGRHEVTNAEFRRFLEATGRIPPEPWAESARLHGDEAPAVGLSWYDATAWCEWAGLRLPTAAEWERAAGAAEYPWGPVLADQVARESEGPSPVGSHSADVTASGCLDMGGNVREWTSSGTGAFRILKGGCYRDSSPAFFRRTHQWPSLKALRQPTVGFRAAADAPAGVTEREESAGG